jgi:hypothetical protein
MSIVEFYVPALNRSALIGSTGPVLSFHALTREAEDLISKGKCFDSMTDGDFGIKEPAHPNSAVEFDRVVGLSLICKGGTLVSVGLENTPPGSGETETAQLPCSRSGN